MIDQLRLTSSPLGDFLVALLIVLVLLKLLDLFLDHIVRRVALWTRFKLDDALLRVLHMPILGFIGLFGVSIAFRLITIPKGITADSFAAASEKTWLLIEHESLVAIDRSLVTMSLIILAFSALRSAPILVNALIARPEAQAQLAREIRPLLINLVKAGVFVALIFAVLSLWEISVTPVLASAGVMGLAVALAAKDTLANFFGGISIFLDRSYQLGDYVVLDGDQRGAVDHVGLRSTRIRTRDDVVITVPNSVMANSKIVNQSASKGRFRVRVPVGVAYGSNVRQVEELMMEIAVAEEMTRETPVPRVRFRSLGDSAINFELLCWCEDPGDRGRLVHNLLTAIYDRFNTEGIEFPYPQMDVYLRGDGTSAAKKPT